MAVNRRVVGSNPTSGANFSSHLEAALTRLPLSCATGTLAQSEIPSTARLFLCPLRECNALDHNFLAGHTGGAHGQCEADSRLAGSNLPNTRDLPQRISRVDCCDVRAAGLSARNHWPLVVRRFTQRLRDFARMDLPTEPITIRI